ncbi:MAG TPA: hypothetical protein VE842_12760, partial [Pyrinomonadaceae bacterium]|nr:hypothetical protein [Pyrinomonadaceae bacterium]
FSETASLIDAYGLAWTRRSSPPSERDASSEVILLDTIGELRAVYPLASLVFVGGSIAPTGGHNVLEPAAVGACVVTGAHTANFEAVMRVLLDSDALVQLRDLREAEAPSELARVFGELLADDDRRRATGERARAVVEENRGASLRTVKLLTPLLLLSPDENDLGQPHDARSDALSA